MLAAGSAGGWPRTGFSGDEVWGPPAPSSWDALPTRRSGRGAVGDLEKVGCFDLRETENLGFQCWKKGISLSVEEYFLSEGYF